MYVVVSEGYECHICEDVSAVTITTTISVAAILPTTVPNDHMTAMAHYLRSRPSRSISNTTNMPSLLTPFMAS